MTNPNLFDLIKLHVAEKHPNLITQFWDSKTVDLGDDQIRISTAEIMPFSNNINCSLIAITKNEADYTVYYVDKNHQYWNNIKLRVESPEFFDMLNWAIDKSLSNWQRGKI